MSFFIMFSKILYIYNVAYGKHLYCTNCCLVIDSTASPAKKARSELSREMKQMIGEDDLNKKIWEELLAGATQDSSVRYPVTYYINHVIKLMGMESP